MSERIGMRRFWRAFVKAMVGGYDFRDSRQIRRRWLLYRTLAVSFFALGAARILFEVALWASGLHANGGVTWMSVLVFGTPGSVSWVKANDHALFWREEVERERASEAAEQTDTGALGENGSA